MTLIVVNDTVLNELLQRSTLNFSRFQTQRPGSSPHICQELLKFLLAVDGPQLQVAGGVAGVTNALVQRPVLVQHQPQTDGQMRSRVNTTRIHKSTVNHLAFFKDTRIQKRSLCSRWRASSLHPHFCGCDGTRGAEEWRCPSHTSYQKTQLTLRFVTRDWIKRHWKVGGKLLLRDFIVNPLISQANNSPPVNQSIRC